MTRAFPPKLDHVSAVDLDATIETATARVAPVWPLDRFIAVNPLWGFLDQRLPEAAAHVGVLSGARLTMPRNWYRSLWEAGRFEASHIDDAIEQLQAEYTALQVIEALSSPEPEVPRRALVTDLRDRERDGSRQVLWSEHVVHSVSQHCASWFDRGQAQIGLPRSAGLFGSWRTAASADLAPAMLMGATGFRPCVQALPGEARAVIATCLAGLEVPPAHWSDYLTALLLDVKGWAAWCAYQRWSARLEGDDDDAIVHLLAIRIAWERILLALGGDRAAERWQTEIAFWPEQSASARDARDIDWLLQTALEHALHAQVARELAETVVATRDTPPDVQMAFCIDVRSEAVRRAVEAQSPTVQTIGFAGFFGLPMAYRPPGATEARPQLPGLLAPTVLVTDPETAGLDDRRRARLGRRGLIAKLAHTSLSGFSFVETMGLSYAVRLVTDAFGWTRPAPHPDAVGLTDAEQATRRPRLTISVDGDPLSVQTRGALATGILTGLGLTRDLARLVVLAGHGSQTVNNPHAAAYDCGACCGQRGDVNARAVAALLNDPEVRADLAERGIDVPETTVFVGALHDTTTDALTLFDTDHVPTSHRDDLERLERWLTAASAATRTERAPSLGLAQLDEPARTRAIEARARDWAQVRPEWGLAGNAWFVLAPRARTSGLDLGGRSFLHDYDWRGDAGFGLLAQLMTAPMVVAHWINFQYYASTVDNRSFGSGNKVLHNVVGGSVGVFEGNGGDLRTGLPMQSLHDGTRLVHEPVRLGVFVEAPRDAIDAVIQEHEVVAHLVHNQWIHLHQIDGDEGAVWRRAVDGWIPMAKR
ncbi:MAG: DUF2309 domain-containing protein [Myxococcota bacterium]